MKQQDSVDKMVELLKKGALKFRDDFDPKLDVYFTEERKEEEIVIHFHLIEERELEYRIVFRKQKTTAEYIPKVKGYEQLDTTSNPYKTLRFTDENAILSNIYDTIKEIDVAEIACYQMFGIILRNPLELKGIYNINIKFMMD